MFLLKLCTVSYQKGGKFESMHDRDDIFKNKAVSQNVVKYVNIVVKEMTRARLH